LAPGPIAATDTAFSSNRFAWTHQIHKLALQAELKETVMNQLCATTAYLREAIVSFAARSTGIPTVGASLLKLT
jgi:hypothetical protein